MTETRRWFARTFELGLPAGEAPGLLTRLRATADRLERAARDLPPALLTFKPDRTTPPSRS